MEVRSNENFQITIEIDSICFGLIRAIAEPLDKQWYHSRFAEVD